MDFLTCYASDEEEEPCIYPEYQEHKSVHPYVPKYRKVQSSTTLFSPHLHTTPKQINAWTPIRSFKYFSACKFQWHPEQSNSYLIASLDGCCQVYANNEPVVMIRHSAAIKDACFSEQGRHVATAAYDGYFRYFDIETSTCLNQVYFNEPAVCVTRVNSNCFLVGYKRCGIKKYDCRMSLPVTEYKTTQGQVQSIELLDDRVFAAAFDDLRTHNKGKNLMLFDRINHGFATRKPVFDESLLISSLKKHPSENYVVAQTGSNCIEMFESKKPFKRCFNKVQIILVKKFAAHLSQGYQIQMDFLGDCLVTGSVSGDIFFYDWKSATVKQILKSDNGNPCVGIVASNEKETFASCYWDGTVNIWSV